MNSSANIPEPSKLGRQRKIRPVKIGLKRKKKHSMSDPTTRTPLERVQFFPNQSLRVDLNKLYCGCCCIELSIKMSTLRNHLKSHDHKKRLQASLEAKERGMSFQSLLSSPPPAHSSATAPAPTTGIVRVAPGRTLPEAVQQHRAEVAYALMIAGVPFAILDGVGPLRR